MEKTKYKYEFIEGYDPIVLKYFLMESMRILNMPKDSVCEWINNGFEISGRELFIEVRESSRRRLRGNPYEVFVLCKIFVENEDGSGHIEEEICGSFPLSAYDKISECVVSTIFNINMESILQNCIRIVDYMSDDGLLPVKDIKDIDDFIKSESLQNEEDIL